MEIKQTGLEGLWLLEPAVHGDARGFFVETYRASWFEGTGVDPHFVQCNHSRSVKGTLRGLHFQAGAGQPKLVRCARGRVWDVAVDIRPDSPTFGQWRGFELDDELHRQLYVPSGFAHGFCVLSDVADFCYQVGRYYDPETESGISWDDPEVGVEWPLDAPLLSERDLGLPRLSEIRDSLLAAPAGGA